MLQRRQVISVSRRFRAASSELGDTAAAGDAWFRMAYLWAWGMQQGRPLDEEDLEVAIWSFQIEYPDGPPSSEPKHAREGGRR